MAHSIGPKASATGDSPLLRTETLLALADQEMNGEAAGTLLSAIMDDPTGYGRVIRNDTAMTGEISLRGLVLACDDLDAEYQRLHTAGVQFDSPPQRQPWATEAVLRDPDGNMLVLQQA